ncbi:MAG: hypothetical protein ABI583_13380, partial [Betaproteobacteria bacterium]
QLTKLTLYDEDGNIRYSTYQTYRVQSAHADSPMPYVSLQSLGEPPATQNSPETRVQYGSTLIVSGSTAVYGSMN